ncbi:MAG: MBL fold metallo-hydrolase [Parcubacteria group bacterium]|nr:MBL fold metallo-hydrolase [Parcubacteria group bacterium]
MRRMSVGFFGGARKIGASCHAFAFEQRGERHIVMVDIGMDPTVAFTPQTWLECFPDMEGLGAFLDNSTTCTVVITHAHFDHVGGVPYFMRWVRGRCPALSVTFFMTEETRSLAGVTWDETEQTMQKGEAWREAEPIYSECDRFMTMSRTRVVKPGVYYEVCPGVRLFPLPAGHILGAIAVGFEAFNEHIVHTGDISFGEQPFIEGAAYMSLPHTRFVVSEATNLGETLPRRSDAAADLGNECRETLNRGGTLLLPAFQIHRAQALTAMLVAEGIPPAAILVDGNAQRVHRIYRKMLPPNNILTGVPLARDVFRGKDARETLFLEMKEGKTFPRIVVASGGMLHGIAQKWAKALLPNKRNAIVLNGWAYAGSPADVLHRAVLRGDASVQLNGDEVPLEAGVRRIRLSSHASGPELERLWTGLNPDAIMLVHGDESKIEDYLKRYGPHAHDAGFVVPRRGEVYEL